MTNKANATIIAIVLLVASGVGLSLGYRINQTNVLRDVRISLSGVTVERADSISATLDVRLRLDNPTGSVVALEGLSYSVYADGVRLGNTTVSRNIEVPPNETSALSIPFTITHGGAACGCFFSGNVTWKVSGTAHFRTSLGGVSLPFTAGSH